MQYNKEDDYWEDAWGIDEVHKLSNFERHFCFIFDSYNKSNFVEARNKLSKILDTPVSYELSEYNTISKREIEFFRDSEEFNSFNFVEE